MESAPGLGLAFAAGLLSFLSPCVLPLVPSYLGVLGGGRSPLVRAVAFIAGFSLVFIALGATASYLGALLAPHKIILGRVGAVLIITFGVFMLGLRPRALMVDSRRLQGADRYGALALGAAFAFGWSPCIGPILGSILSFAASSASLPLGVGLLAMYTVGLAVPFLLAALWWRRLNLKKLARLSPILEKTGGVILIVVGVLMLTGEFTRLAAFFFTITPEWLRQYL